MTEKELIDWLIENVDDSIKPALYQFSAFDAYSSRYDCFIELKCRSKHYPSLLLEKKKFDSVTEDGPAYYICSTPKGIYSWKLDREDEPQWITKTMPKNTEFGSKQKKEKLVTFLRIAEAKKLK